ncbi:hypothetical protein POTOM_034572 [Populus tomentosa]|uniref:anthocyanidin 3-O-glucosyltransferase n=1 Tax=Populus tomentosa TaxID=118781 RepID=A0A8X7Z5L2_POPTO|nr:hypothetical protein POTOM_034572 [Populus tomentosa]
MLKSSTINPTSSPISISGVQVRFFSDGQSLNYDRMANYESYKKSLAKFGTINLSNLIKEHFPSNGHKKLSCIITNPFVTWVADVAINLGIPCAMFWIQPCSLYAIYYRFYNKLNSFPTLTDPDMSVELPGLPLLHTEDLPSFVLPSNPFGSLPKMFSEMFQNVKSPIGPLVPPSLLGEDEDHDTGVEMWKAEDTCIEWLNKEAPSSVIYQPDLPEPDGAGQLPLGFLEETKDQGVVVSWSPQTKALAHPATACFITHCGWNSVLETVAAGVPVIAYPKWSDQPTNAKLIVDVFRIGLRLKANQDGIVSNEEVERCIREIMGSRREGQLPVVVHRTRIFCCL